MKNMRFFALAFALFASSNLLAVVFPSYVAKPLTDLKISPKAEVDQINIVAKHLDKYDLTKLFGSHADTLTKKFRIIQCTVENGTDKDFRIVGNHIEGLDLVKAADVAAVLNPMSWTRLAATTGLPLVGSFLSEGLYVRAHYEVDRFLPSWQEFVAPTIIGAYDFPKRLLKNPTKIPSLINLIIKYPNYGGMDILFGAIVPFAFWTTAAISFYKSFRTGQLIKQDLANKILSSGDPKFHFGVVQPHQTKSFLLVSPIEQPAAKQITIEGIAVPVD